MYKYPKPVKINTIEITLRIRPKILHVVSWVRQCDVCARCKPEHSAPVGLLQPLSTPSQAW